jgi:tetratricopeptide (TPR) repeat protein
MRYLLIALLLAFASASAQNVNDKPISGDKPTSSDKPISDDKVKSAELAEANQKFVDAAVKAAGSREAAARIEITRGWKYLKQGDVEVAIQSFNQAYLLDPNNVEVYWGLGNAMTQQSRFSAALRYYERATTIDPQNPQLMADVGLSHTYAAFGSTNDPAEQAKGVKTAMQWFDNAEKIDPNRPEIYANRAVALYLLGNYTEAWTNIDKAEAIEPSSIDPRFIADLTKKLPRGESKKAASTTDGTPVKPEAVPMAVDPNGPQPTPSSQADKQEAAPKPLADKEENPASAIKEDQDEEAAAEPVKKEVVAPADANKKETAVTTPTDEKAKDATPAAEKTAQTAPAQIEKPSEVMVDKNLPQIGPDKRDCLKLSTNEEIIRCVYPKK